MRQARRQLNWQKQYKVSKSAIEEWIVWYSDFVITNAIMPSSFKYSGISNLLDGSEDDRIRGNEDIEKGNEIIQI